MTKYWFKPKRYGYGATPSSWEGWLICIVFIIYIIWRIPTLNQSNIRFFLELIVLIIILVYISKKKTDGSWKWRWGNK